MFIKERKLFLQFCLPKSGMSKKIIFLDGSTEMSLHVSVDVNTVFVFPNVMEPNEENLKFYMEYVENSILNGKKINQDEILSKEIVEKLNKEVFGSRNLNEAKPLVNPKAEAEKKARKEAAKKAKKEAKEKSKKDAEGKDVEEKKASEEKIKKEMEEKIRKEMEVKAKEDKEKVEKEAKEKAEKEAKEKAEKEAKEKAEKEAAALAAQKPVAPKAPAPSPSSGRANPFARR